MMISRALALLVISLACIEESQAQSLINVGANTQVTKSEDDHIEILAAADPTHPDRLITCYMVSSLTSSPYWTAASVSFDGGSSWSETVAERISDQLDKLWSLDFRSLDPTCAYGPGGTVYFGAVLGKDLEASSDFFRSPDGGRTWTSPVAISGAWDRPYIAVDVTGGKYNGRIYVNHTFEIRDFDSSPTSYDSASVSRGMGLQRSLDGGRSFLGPAARVGIVGEHHAFTSPGNSVVLSDGTVVSLFFEFDPVAGSKELYHDADGSLKVIFSRDGGESYVDSTKVADHFEDRRYNIGMQTVPSLAVDPGSPLFKDRLYVAWHESKDHYEEGLLSYSADKGKTWSRPVRFSDVRARTDTKSRANEFQVAAAANKEGVVGVMWYETSSPDRGDYSVRFAASLDGGETWLPSVRVSEAPNTVEGNEHWIFKAGASHASRGQPISVFIRRSIWQSSGHTAGLATDSNGTFHAFWIDNRTAIRQVWTAPIVVSGTVIKNGSKELANLEDISDKVDVEVGRVAFDRAKHVLSAALRLKNISQEKITAPVKLRIVKVLSPVCRLEALRGEEPIGIGTILDFTDRLRGGVLKPNDFSSPYDVHFTLDCNETFRSERKWIDPILEFDVRVFAKP